MNSNITLEDRVASLEEAIKKVLEDCGQVLEGQKDAKTHLEKVAQDQADAIIKVGREVQERLLDQSEAILKVSQAMLKLQQAVQRWAAAGTLCGAVVLFIVAKAAGL